VKKITNYGCHLKDIPVTTIIRVRPKEGFEKQTLDWFHSISEKASHFNGHLGSEIFETCNRSSPREFVNIFHFDTYENLMHWENSNERNKQVELSTTFFEQVKPRLQLTGLELWFETKNVKANNAPVKWKMMVLTIATIFILLNTLIPLFQKIFIALTLPPLLRSLLSVIILVVTMTYLIMPMLTKLFSGWLAKKSYDDKN
jgi:antibiotic biosynthesis monooxygenase (ABM) superfamily enzyme